MRIPKRKSEQLKNGHSDEGSFYVTDEGFRRLNKTLEDLEKKQLPEAQEDVRRTGEFGDFSENAEYQEAKARMRGLGMRILALKEKIKRAVVIKKTTGDRVQLGSTVVVRIDDEQKTYQIVGPHETNPGRGRISNVSPLGTALVGHAVGNQVSVRTVNGETFYQIIEIR